MCENEGVYRNEFNVMTHPPPFKADGRTLNLDFKERLDEEWRKMAEKQPKKSNVKPTVDNKGIKGVCQLSRLSYVNMATICTPEPMHSQWLGTILIMVISILVQF